MMMVHDSDSAMHSNVVTYNIANRIEHARVATRTCTHALAPARPHVYIIIVYK